jgi:SAM-dependent methyltransferase
MRREKAFSKDGFYKFVLDSNLMLHDHVARAGQRHLLTWLSQNLQTDPVNVLDLACGGEPASISRMIAGCPARRFCYTGVDVNPDQVEAANRFQFPGNVIASYIKEGNAWELSSLDLDAKYDIIFSGMNLHHGTPEEVQCLLQQCRRRLSDVGLFINHDFYRPSALPFLRRPNCNPVNPAESYVMISSQTLAEYNCEVDKNQQDEAAHSDWRQALLVRYRLALRERGVPEPGIEELSTHVLGRDFPISTDEMTQIAHRAGFVLNVIDLQASDQPLCDYFSLVIASPARAA